MFFLLEFLTEAMIIFYEFVIPEKGTMEMIKIRLLNKK